MEQLDKAIKTPKKLCEQYAGLLCLMSQVVSTAILVRAAGLSPALLYVALQYPAPFGSEVT